MACFLVPTTEAIVVTAVAQIMKAKAKKEGRLEVHAEHDAPIGETVKVAFWRKLMWLADLLWGGAFLLAYEHLWHGEVVPWFPFLTAAADPTDTAVMLHEMSTVGVSMAVLVTAVWVVMVLVSNAIQKRRTEPETTSAAA